MGNIRTRRALFSQGHILPGVDLKPDMGLQTPGPASFPHLLGVAHCTGSRGSGGGGDESQRYSHSLLLPGPGKGLHSWLTVTPLTVIHSL